MTKTAIQSKTKPHDADKEYAARLVTYWTGTVALAAFLFWMVFSPAGYGKLLRFLVPGSSVVTYPGAPLSQLMGEHILIVTIASSIALVIGVGLGLLVLSRIGRPFRDVLVALANLVQAIPTVAVIMLAVPLTGYGMEPVIIGLVLYSILPIMLNVIVGIEDVSPAARDAARGIGMSATQRLVSVELPLAFPVILGSIKNMLVINISAATVGAVAAAGGLGQIILAGFSTYNTAFIVQGALPVGVLALLVDRLLTQPQPKFLKN